MEQAPGQAPHRQRAAVGAIAWSFHGAWALVFGAFPNSPASATFRPDMNDNTAPKLTKIPFLIGDVLLLATAAWLVLRGESLGLWQGVFVVAAVAIAAWFGIAPFVMEFRAQTKLDENSQLTNATAQLENLEDLARQISSAGAQWQSVHQGTTQTVTAAEQIAEKMISEARNFGELLARLNETEKQHLRLEVEKLRRAEGDWLQILVRILDHVHALHQAGARTGQKNLADQLTQFQNACRDTVRRVGLAPIVPAPDAAFDPKQHQLLEGQTAKDGALVGDLLAPGYTFQGQLLRLPLVAVKSPAPAPKKAEETEALPLFPENA